MIDIKRLDRIDWTEPLSNRLTGLYQTVMEEIDTLAANRHQLYDHECRKIWQNDRIQKWIGFDGTTPVGMSVITNSLHDWPLISPRFFKRLDPERYEFRKIWYVGFIGIQPDADVTLYAELIKAMAPQVIEDDGRAAMDFCSYNRVIRRMDRATAALLKRLARHSGDRVARGGEVDSQGFYSWEFLRATG
jgi:hypothetical protein